MSKISYSAWKKYHTCPRLFKFHYVDRVRPVGTTSALKFGIAIDEALNALLLGTGEPLKVFRDFFKWEELQDVEWMRGDYDADLFDESQSKKISGETYEYKAWASMRIKGRLLIEQYVAQIYPLITKVYHVQKDLDDRPGVLDALVDLKGYGKVLVDHKTAGRPYEPDAVLTDTQLALYAESEGCTKAGFVVLNKKINMNKIKICKACKFDGSFARHKTCPKEIGGKRCGGPWDESVAPEAYIQLIVDDVPQSTQALIKESMDDTEAAIKAGHFPRNLNSCSKMYGKPCPYYNKCWNNDSSNLETKEKK